MKTVLIAAALLGTALGGAALAQSTAERNEGRFKRWDTNGDGIIIREELLAVEAQRASEVFDRLDANDDGKVAPEEMPRRRAGRMDPEQRRARIAERLKAADTNADGLLSKDEVQAGMPRLVQRFDQVDANRDGQISVEELQARGAARSPKAR